MNYFNPESRVQKSGDTLPHWQQGPALQFVTFRLADALPPPLIRRWKAERNAWLAAHPQPWLPGVRAEFHRRFTQQIERWLDEGMGSCLFADPEARQVLADCLMHFEGERVRHEAWVIMPNHVHLLFCPLVPLGELIKSWKGYSSHVLGRGPIWQRGYRDTLIRDEEHHANVLHYIRRNPIKAELPEGTFTLWEREPSLHR